MTQVNGLRKWMYEGKLYSQKELKTYFNLTKEEILKLPMLTQQELSVAAQEAKNAIATLMRENLQTHKEKMKQLKIEKDKKEIARIAWEHAQNKKYQKTK